MLPNYRHSLLISTSVNIPINPFWPYSALVFSPIKFLTFAHLKKIMVKWMCSGRETRRYTFIRSQLYIFKLWRQVIVYSEGLTCPA